ncbi:MAG: permease [Verrucomicrobiota bacterium]|nr:permease [Verrucomicrobiota bacterium]MEC8905579.1 permease [Verrucomicrobiota bacterium]MED6299289.1 permease [Verrucomicrobiota bacterium]
MPFTEPSQIGDLYFAFLGILFEGAPYILLGTIISGFIDAYLPSNMIDRFLPKNRYAAIAFAGLLGAIFPVCECAIVPVIRRLVQKGLPVSCAITYMLSAPIVNPIVALSTYSAFAGNDPLFMTLSRIGIAYLITVLVGVVVHQFSIRSILRNNLLKKIQSDSQKIQFSEVLAKNKETPDRLLIAFRSAARDFLDVGMYFVIGVMITALYRTQIDQGVVDQFGSSDLIGIPAMMILAFVLSLCSTSDAFIAAQMLSFSSAAKLAFLTYGPMMDVKLVFMYSSVFKPRFVLSLAIGLFIVIGIVFYQWNNIPVPGT